MTVERHLPDNSYDVNSPEAATEVEVEGARGGRDGTGFTADRVADASAGLDAHRQTGRPKEHLPELGDWDGPIYGQLGILAVEEDGSHVQCHACSRWYKALAQHARWTHQLTADEYRAIFGLNAGTALDAPALRDIKRRNSADLLAHYRAQYPDVLQQQTPAERRANTSGPRRLQTRLDPHNRAVWQRMQTAGVERTKQLWQDPAYAEARAKHMSEARAGRIRVSCAICGTELELARWEVRGEQRHTCGEACHRELQRRLLAERGCLRSPEVREKAQTTRRHTLASRPEYGSAVGATISEARRRRDQTVVVQLREMPSEAWEALPEPDRTMVRRYYGLDEEPPATLAELMGAFRLQHRQVRRMVEQSTARLLNYEACDMVAAPYDEWIRHRMAIAARLAALPERVLAELSDLDRRIVVRFYGLNDEVPGHQREIARELGISRRQVRTALARAVTLFEPI